MCGPLALCAGGGGASLACYQGGRAAAYVAVGLAAGAAGGALGPAGYVPGAGVAFVLAGALLLGAFAGGRLGALPVFAGPARALARRAARLPDAARAGALGLLTPLLPCGLLWIVVAAALASGSALAGAGTMAGFALGSLPILLAAQLNGAWLRARVTPRARRIVLVAAAAVLAWRGFALLANGGSACCT
jgi:sulfite exporter TauE/SafE